MNILQRWIKRTLGAKKIAHSRPKTTRLNLEALEDRLTPSVYPMIAITAPAISSFTNNTEPTVTATASDTGGPGLASVQFQYGSIGGSWNNIGPVETTAPFSFTFTSPLAEGAYQVRAIATDTASNSTTSSNYTLLSTLGTFDDYDDANGAYPLGGLVEDSGGNLFGTTQYGGAARDGTVFEIAKGSGAITTLASFNGNNGLDPAGGLVEDSGGNLFGTTQQGGAYGYDPQNYNYGEGTVFEIAHGSGAITTLASFNGTNGASPDGLVEDSGGNLFGAAGQGGAYGYGTVFEITHGSGAITALASFNYANGAYPAGSLVDDSGGNLFGTASGGGDAAGDGTVFEIANGSGVITTLASFNDTNGANPDAGLVEDGGGNLFGTTNYGGSGLPYGYGTVFEIAHGSGAITTLASFNGTNGANSDAGLVEDSGGNLFGTTSAGGDAAGDGTIFEVANGSGAITTLASFNNTNGAYPSVLVEDGAGNLSGVSSGGGADGDGTVFELANAPVFFSIDTTPPSTTITASPPAHASTASATFVFTGSDPISGGVSSGVNYFQYSFDGGSFTTASSPVTFTGLADGMHTFQVRAVDNAGNIGAASSYSWTVNAFPVVMITAPAYSGFTNNTEPTVTASAYELGGSGLASVQFQYSGDGGSTWNDAGAAEMKAPFSYTFPSALADGAYEIRAIAADNSGNSTTSSNYTSPSTLGAFGQSGNFGGYPDGGVIEDGNGNLFGATLYGGAPDDGTVFEIAQGSGIITTLAAFNQANGAYPRGDLVEDSGGNLFGTTEYGGASDNGTVYEIAQGSGSVTTLASFNGTNGADPYAGLVEDSGGNLFGTAANGGASHHGTVFEIAQGSGVITTLASFNGATSGASPNAGLIEDGTGNLFGTTASGDGTIFEITAGSGVISTLASFNGTNGASPEGRLVEDGIGDLFGTTTGGGQYGGGTLFKVVPGSDIITALASFNSTGASGSFPIGDLVEDSGGNLFGTAANGGASNHGTVFEVAAGSGVITTLAAFNGTNGYNPLGGLIEDSGGNLFGTTNFGGTAPGNGNVFELSPTAYSSFSIDTTAPTASITAKPPTYSNSTQASFSFTGNDPVSGGVSSDVNSFQYSLDGSGFAQVSSPATLIVARGTHTFQVRAVDNAGNVGAATSYSWTVDLIPPSVTVTTPVNNSVTDNNEPTFTATASDNTGGSGVASIQFQYSTSGSGTWINAGAPRTTAPFSFTFPSSLADSKYAVRAIATDNAGNFTISSYSSSTLASFNDTNGAFPIAGLIEDSGGNLFGTGSGGGANGDGAVFEIAHGSHAISTLASFDGTNGDEPDTALVEDGAGNLFGATAYGGASGEGAVFEIVHGSHTIATLASFNDTNGADPQPNLIEDSGGNLFGATYEGGTSGVGTVFEIAKGSGVITTLASFNGMNGAYPEVGLVEDGGGDLFGTTAYGGMAGDGTVFEIAKGSGVITTLAFFNGTNGSNPDSLVEDGSGNLFGTALGGGSGYGTVFEIAQGSGVISTLASFNDTDGANPLGGLIEDSGGNLFGTTYQGGMSGGGTLFEIVHGSGVITALVSFNGGVEPKAGLFEDSGGNLFGTTEYGGVSGDGSVFELANTPVFFTIDTTPPADWIIAEPPAVSSSTSASFSYSGNDPISGGVSSGVSYFQYQLDGDGYQTAASPVDLTGFTYGSHTFQVEAVDKAGNVGVPASYTWTVATPAISSIAVNGSTAPIIAAAVSGGGVTITTDGPSGFSPGQSVLIAGVDGTGTASGFNGAFIITSVNGNTFTYADASAAGSSSGSGTATTNTAAGLLTNGASNATSQRSMVDSIVYTFNQAVNLGANALTITVLGQGGVVPTVAYASPNGGMTWVVTFSGSGVVGNSIANGEYQITLNGAAVTAVAGGGTLAGNDSESFYRLYGDTVGNGHARVNTNDTNAFLGAFNTRSTSTAFLAYLDYEDDGRINSVDTNAFLGDFNTKYSSFAATI